MVDVAPIIPLALPESLVARDSQSAPTVLLNWLRGKSTPKVVHIRIYEDNTEQNPEHTSKMRRALIYGAGIRGPVGLEQ
ncbi:unnamed protein product [Leptidea sinapis]|uniref:Uncharacterized protein n=1 Tax=Leptidea sinapis TaxID=189913 RepID=A0A5E4R0H1_9NEOP|nr:unnamed protein product [Leptidea sinapis]